MALTIISIIVFQGLIFLGLVFLLKQFMKGNVRGELGHLQQLNDELMKRQQELKEKNETAEKEFSAKMTKLEQEISAKQTKVSQDATKSLEEMREKAMKEREKIISEAIETREKIRQEIMAEMEVKAIQHANEILSEFFSGQLREMLHQILIQQLLDGLAEVNLSSFQIDTDIADLRVAQTMPVELKNKMIKVLKEKIKRDVKCKEEVDEGLIGGVILRFGNFVIDGSMVNRLQEAGARLRKETHRRYQNTT